MNIYEDYINYMSEHSSFVEKLYSTNSQVLLCIDDVVKVCDYIYQMTQKEEVSDEIAQIFEIGYGYLVNTISDLETYYKEYLNQDIVLFNNYNTLLIYALMIDDFKSYLISNEEYPDEIKKAIEDMENQIDQVVCNKESFSEDLVKELTFKLERLDFDKEFKPTYIVFSMILEELQN